MTQAGPNRTNGLSSPGLLLGLLRKRNIYIFPAEAAKCKHGAVGGCLCHNGRCLPESEICTGER